MNNQYTKKELMEHPNLTSVLFLFDQKVDPLEIQERAFDIAPKYKTLSQTQRDIIETWLQNTMNSKLASFLIKLLKSSPREGAEMIANNSRILNEFEEAAEARGEKKGLEEGRKSANIETAINLLKLKTLDDETIAASVGLSLEVVQQLKEGMVE